MKRYLKTLCLLICCTTMLLSANASDKASGVDGAGEGASDRAGVTDNVYTFEADAEKDTGGNKNDQYKTESKPHVETDEERKQRKENELTDLIKKLLEDAKIEVIDWDMRMDEIGDYIDDNREDLGVPPDVDFSIGDYDDIDALLPQYKLLLEVFATRKSTPGTVIPGEKEWTEELPNTTETTLVWGNPDDDTITPIPTGIIQKQSATVSLNYLAALGAASDGNKPNGRWQYTTKIKEQAPIVHPGTEDIVIPGATYWDIRFKIWLLATGGSLQDDDWTEEIEDQFVNKPNINDKYSDKVSPGTLPGTDITVYYPKDLDSLYELLTQYIKELQDLKISSSNITEYVTYNTTYVGQQIVHRYIPGTDYIFEVTNTSGMQISTTTHTNYTKILFRAPGTYRVRVYNVANAYRNNYLAGEKHTYYVINDGGYYDGLVVYHDSESFDGWLDEDTGPELVNVPLKKDGFDTTITQAMTNIVQLMDTTGNVLSPASDFTTERWS